MDTLITPAEAIDRIARAHLSVSAFLKRGEISSSTFWRWQNQKVAPRRLTVQKIIDTLDELETQRTGEAA